MEKKKLKGKEKLYCKIHFDVKLSLWHAIKLRIAGLSNINKGVKVTIKELIDMDKEK